MAASHDASIAVPRPLDTTAHVVEQRIAVARLGIALIAIPIATLDPGQAVEVRSTLLTLLAGYVLLAVGAGALVRRPQPWAFGVATHLVDVAIAAAVTLLADGPNSPFSLLLIFPIVTAAYRWGFIETLITGMLAFSLLALESLWVVPAFEGAMHPMRTLVRVLYLAALAILVGSLADVDKRQQAEATSLARMLGEVRLGRPLGDTLQAVLRRVGRLFGASRVVVVMQQVRTGRTFRSEWVDDAGGASGEGARVVPRELPAADGYDYLLPLSGVAAYLTRPPGQSGQYRVRAIDADGRGLPVSRLILAKPLPADLVCRRMLAVAAAFEDRWHVRVFILDPALTLRRLTATRQAWRLMQVLGPAVFAQAQTTRVGARASQAERARIVRELHDGPVQSLLGVEMELAVLRRRAHASMPEFAPELARFHDTLKHEVIGLREVFEGVRAGATPNRPLQHDLADLVSRFAIYTGLDARYTGDHVSVLLPPMVRRELLRMVHESFANIRKHSGARRVVVRTDVQQGHLLLQIEDNGRGFGWAGTRTDQELRDAHEGPWSIMERAAAIGARLQISSRPGAGATLEWSVPLTTSAAAMRAAAASSRPSPPGVLV